MVTAFWPWGFDSLAPTKFRAFAWLNGRSLNGVANVNGFHGANMGAFYGGLYRRKLGYILNRVFRAFPVRFCGNKKRCKGGLPLQTNLLCLSVVPCYR